MPQGIFDHEDPRRCLLLQPLEDLPAIGEGPDVHLRGGEGAPFPERIVEPQAMAEVDRERF